MASAFQQLCEQRNVLPHEWKQSLRRPIIPDKSLLDMTDEELERHYNRVEQHAEDTKEDRALIVLEKAQEGRLERQAVKVFNQHSTEGQIRADQVPEMLEALRFEVSNTEVHFLLKKFDATKDFDMIPEKELSKRQWLWLVGECQKLKDSYKFTNQEAFETCYETSIQNLKLQKDAGLKGTHEWPYFKPTGWLMTGEVPQYTGPLKPYVWGLQPEVEEEIMKQMAMEEAKAAEKRAEELSRASEQKVAESATKTS